MKSLHQIKFSIGIVDDFLLETERFGCQISENDEKWDSLLKLQIEIMQRIMKLEGEKNEPS